MASYGSNPIVKSNYIGELLPLYKGRTIPREVGIEWLEIAYPTGLKILLLVNLKNNSLLDVYLETQPYQNLVNFIE